MRRDVSRLPISHPCRRATIATPESAEPARAQNSLMPKSLKKAAVIQSISGGFSNQG